MFCSGTSFWSEFCQLSQLSHRRTKQHQFQNSLGRNLAVPAVVTEGRRAIATSLSSGRGRIFTPAPMRRSPHVAPRSWPKLSRSARLRPIADARPVMPRFTISSRHSERRELTTERVFPAKAVMAPAKPGCARTRGLTFRMLTVPPPACAIWKISMCGPTRAWPVISISMLTCFKWVIPN